MVPAWLFKRDILGGPGHHHASSVGENLAADLTLTSDELMAIRGRVVEV